LFDKKALKINALKNNFIAIQTGYCFKAKENNFPKNNTHI